MRQIEQMVCPAEDCARQIPFTPRHIGRVALYTEEPNFNHVIVTCASACPATNYFRIFNPDWNFWENVARLGVEPVIRAEPEDEVVQGYQEATGTQYHPATYTELGIVGDFADALVSIESVEDLEW